MEESSDPATQTHDDISEEETQLIHMYTTEDDANGAIYVESEHEQSLSLVEVEMNEGSGTKNDVIIMQTSSAEVDDDDCGTYDEASAILIEQGSLSGDDIEEDDDQTNEARFSSPKTETSSSNLIEHYGFTCDLCHGGFKDQFSFFEHLKTHYDGTSSRTPLKPEAAQKSTEHPDSHTLREKLKVLKARRQNKINLLPQKTVQDPDGDMNSPEFSNKRESAAKPKTLELVQQHEDDYTVGSEPYHEQEIGGDNYIQLKEEVDSNESSYSEPELEDELIKEAYTETLLEREAEVVDVTEVPGKKPRQQQEILCPDCGQFFESLAKLKAHKKSAHDEAVVTRKTHTFPRAERFRLRVTSLKCKECSRVFSHKNSLVYHMKGHTNERNHECAECGKKFLTSSALTVHTRLHTGEKPYQCPTCGKPFRQWGDLSYHMVSLHSNIKKFVCEFCGKDFARKYSLTVHRRIHTLERDYTCEYCSKSFRAASYLQSHRRIHTGEKPHNCDVCGKPFRVRSDMKRHLQSHNRHEPKVRIRKEKPLPSKPSPQPTPKQVRVPLTRSKLTLPATIVQDPIRTTRRLDPVENGVIVHNLVAVDESGQIIELEPQLAEQLRAGQVIQVPLPTQSHRMSRRITIENADGSTITGDLNLNDDEDNLKEEEQEVSVEFMQHATVIESEGGDTAQGSLYVWPAYL